MEDQPNTPPTDTAEPQAAPTAEMPSNDELNMAMLAHLLALFTGFIGPLIIWLIKKEQSEFVDDQGKESLNFQICSFIIFIGLSVLSIIPFVGCITILMLLAWFVVWVVFIIIATVKSKAGERYRYPINIRLLS